MEKIDFKKLLDDLFEIQKQQSNLDNQIRKKEKELYSAIETEYSSVFAKKFEDIIKSYELPVENADEQKSKGEIINNLKRLYGQQKPLIEAFNEQKERCMIAFESFKENLINDYSNDSIPLISEDIPNRIAIGNYSEENKELFSIIHQERLFLPYTIEVEDSGNFIVDIHNEKMNKKCEKIVAGITMKYLESFPSGKIRATLFSSQMDFLNSLNTLFLSVQNGKIGLSAKTSMSFKELFQLINSNCEIIKGKMFELGCKNLNDLFNSGIQTEPFQLVVLYDVLQSFNTDDLKNLNALLSNAKTKLGVRIILFDDFREELYTDKPKGFIEEIKKLSENNSLFKFDNEKLIDCNNREIIPVKFKDSVDEQKIYDYCSEYCKLQDKLKAKYLSYEDIGFGKQSVDKDNYDNILIPVGLCDNKIVEMGFSCKSDYPIANLIMGVPGTGKSKLIDALILNGAMKYFPQELQFQLLDFKDGVSSSLYAEKARLPHIQIISSNNDADDANIILNKIKREREKRNGLFKEKGVNDISEYNKIMDKQGFTDKKLPRIIIIIDECQVLFADSELAGQLEDISRRCRSTGIHLVLSTQALQGSMNKTKEFIDGRYCFEISDSDAHELLNREYANRMKQDVPKGSFKAYASTNSGETCKVMAVAYDGGKTVEYAEQIRNKWNTYKVNTLIAGNQSALYFSNNDGLFSRNNLTIPIGEDYVGMDTLFIDGENSEPILMVGTNQNVADSVHQSVLLESVYRGAKIVYIDATRSKTVLSKIKDINADHLIETGGKQDYMNKLGEIYEQFISRKRADDESYEPIVFSINGIDMIDSFKNNNIFTVVPDSTNVVKKKTLKTNEDDFSDEKDELLRYLDKENVFDDVVATEEFNNVEDKKLDVKGKDTLLQIMEEGFSVNILVCVSMNNVSFKDISREPVFNSMDRKMLTDIDHKIIYNETDSGLSGIMETKFKERIMDKINDEMAVLSQKLIYRFRYYQYGDDTFELILKMFLEMRN